jgi:hypothetical protein
MLKALVIFRNLRLQQKRNRMTLSLKSLTHYSSQLLMIIGKLRGKLMLIVLAADRLNGNRMPGMESSFVIPKVVLIGGGITRRSCCLYSFLLQRNIKKYDLQLWYKNIEL